MKYQDVIRFLDKASFALGIIFFFALIISAFSQVVARYLLGGAMAWPEEVCGFLFMFITYFGMVIAMNSNSHMRIDALLVRLSPRARWFMDLYCYVITLAFCILLTILGCDMVYEIFDMEQYAIALPIPIYLVVCAIPVCFFLTGLSSVNNIVKHCRNQL